MAQLDPSQKVLAAAGRGRVDYRHRSHSMGAQLHRAKCDEAVHRVNPGGYSSGKVTLTYCNSEIATSDIAVTPVRNAGSATGANTLECSDGSGAPEAIFAGSAAPSQKRTVGI